MIGQYLVSSIHDSDVGTTAQEASSHAKPFIPLLGRDGLMRGCLEINGLNILKGMVQILRQHCLARISK